MTLQSSSRPGLALAFLLAAVVGARTGSGATGLPPTELPGLRYTNEFFPGAIYRTSVPTPEALLGFPAGERAATSTEIERCLEAWTNAVPDRTRLVEYARSHEGRALRYLVLASPANRARLDEIQAGMRRLGDPRQVDEAGARELIQRLPAVAWLAHTIHGDETEGSDAALSMIHHLLAAEDPAVARLFDELVIIIDPLMNPDGRDRFLKMVAEHRGATPNVDEQSLLHSGYWPWGRGNHYLFDLNRDWLFAVHPETRGRIREVARWNPVLFVDAHGMGAQETHLFSPPREPINPNIPASRLPWTERFAAAQAAAFDQRGLVYYSGEWLEEWYPGYSDGWSSYRGAIGILYEQARIAADGVRRPEGRILSYRESVLHHLVGMQANLTTAATHAKELLAYLHENRREALNPGGAYGRRTFAVLPTSNASRLRDFAELMQLQGFEIYTNAAALTVVAATNQTGIGLTNVPLPAGTLLIPNRQPLGHLLSAFLEFDTRLPEVAVEDERREVLRVGQSRIYDITSWNLTMMYGLPALTLAGDLPAGAGPYAPPTGVGEVVGPTAKGATAVGWVIDGADDLSLAAAARLLERGVQVRAAERPFAFDGEEFARGSVVVTRLDNRTFTGDLAEQVARTAHELGVPVRAVASGLGPGVLPDLGGGHFFRLEPLRVATLGRDGVNLTDYGSIWHTLDHRLGIRHSQLDAAQGADLGRYNVIIMPERGGGDVDRLIEPLKQWVSAGGTLVAMGGASAALMQEKTGLSRVRPLPEVQGRLAEYELAVLREWQARTGPLPPASNLWAHLPPARIEFPWQAVEAAYPDEKELKKRDAWLSVFMPQGAFLATRIDTNHWLTAGCPEPLPVLASGGPVLMAAEGVDAPIRFGVLTPAPAPPVTATNTNGITNTNRIAGVTAAAAGAGEARVRAEGAAGSEGEAKGERKDAKEPGRLGWCALPPGTQMHLRMSGLVWPEATHRFASSAWVTRESVGRGQVILFASPPTFRGGARGTMRVFLNAVVLGPGFGASTSLRP